MILAKKVRIYPTKEQEQKLWQSVGTARFIYNYTLAKQEENYKNGGKFINDGVIRKELTQLKKSELTWLSEVSNNITKQSVKDACKAYKRFFKSLANKPKFKSKKKSKPSFYNDPIKLKVKKKKVLIEKVGWIKINEQIPINVKYNNPRITYDNKYWYLSVGIEVDKKQEELTNISLGIDLGLKELAICSDGKVFKNINKTKKVKKLENTTKLIYRKLANIRNNYIHQVTTSIVKTKPYRIVIEDLNVSGMMKNKHLSDSVKKQCFHKFRQYITYKSELNGIELVVVDRFYPSSKTCNKCGFIKKDLKLKDRVYRCPHCGAVIDRDLNASLNLSMYKLA